MGAAVHRAPGLRLVALLLAVLIFVGSLTLVAIPLGWLWLIAHLDQPYMTVYFLALIGCPAMTVAWALGLSWLNRAYLRVIGNRAERPQLLELSITVAVMLAASMLVVWLLSGTDGGPIQGPWPG
jgi:hypothetical protein